MRISLLRLIQTNASYLLSAFQHLSSSYNLVSALYLDKSSQVNHIFWLVGHAGCRLLSLDLFLPAIVTETPAALPEAPYAQVFDLSQSFSVNNFLCLSLSISGKIRTPHANNDCFY